jgi:hypothetical protein
VARTRDWWAGGRRAASAVCIGTASAGLCEARPPSVLLGGAAGLRLPARSAARGTQVPGAAAAGFRLDLDSGRGLAACLPLAVLAERRQTTVPLAPHGVGEWSASA